MPSSSAVKIEKHARIVLPAIVGGHYICIYVLACSRYNGTFTSLFVLSTEDNCKCLELECVGVPCSSVPISHCRSLPCDWCADSRGRATV